MLLCLSRIVGFAGLASLFLLHIFLSLLVKKVGTRRCTRSYMSSFMLTLILLTFVLCCCVSQETLAVLVSLVCFGFIFGFFLFLEKMVGIPMQKVSCIMLKVDAEIANICFV